MCNAAAAQVVALRARYHDVEYTPAIALAASRVFRLYHRHYEAAYNIAMRPYTLSQLRGPRVGKSAAFARFAPRPDQTAIVTGIA